MIVLPELIFNALWDRSGSDIQARKRAQRGRKLSHKRSPNQSQVQTGQRNAFETLLGLSEAYLGPVWSSSWSQKSLHAIRWTVYSASSSIILGQFFGQIFDQGFGQVFGSENTVYAFTGTDHNVQFYRDSQNSRSNYKNPKIYFTYFNIIVDYQLQGEQGVHLVAFLLLPANMTFEEYRSWRCLLYRTCSLHGSEWDPTQIPDGANMDEQKTMETVYAHMETVIRSDQLF